jgi:predicted nucleic acid-binding protein
MTEEVIFVDSTVFLAFLIDGKDIFENLKGCRLITSINVIEEVIYVLIKERAKEITGIDRHYDLLQHLRKNPEIVKNVADEIINDVSTILDTCDIDVVSPPHHMAMFEIVKKYGLLPNDALIVATCRYYGIRKIATLDEDFKRVDFLEVVDI